MLLLCSLLCFLVLFCSLACSGTFVFSIIFPRVTDCRFFFLGTPIRCDQTPHAGQGTGTKEHWPAQAPKVCAKSWERCAPLTSPRGSCAPSSRPSSDSTQSEFFFFYCLTCSGCECFLFFFFCSSSDPKNIMSAAQDVKGTTRDKKDVRHNDKSTSEVDLVGKRETAPSVSRRWFARARV